MDDVVSSLSSSSYGRGHDHGGDVASGKVLSRLVGGVGGEEEEKGYAKRKKNIKKKRACYRYLRSCLSIGLGGALSRSRRASSRQLSSIHRYSRDC